MAEQTSAVKTPGRSTQHYVPKDRTRVHPGDARNLRYWAGRFRVTVGQLLAAVEVWGVEIADIRLLLHLADPEPGDPAPRATLPTAAEEAEWASLFVELVRAGGAAIGAGLAWKEARDFLLNVAHRHAGKSKLKPR